MNAFHTEFTIRFIFVVFSSLGIHWPLTTKQPNFQQAVLDVPSGGALLNLVSPLSTLLRILISDIFSLKRQVSLDLEPTLGSSLVKLGSKSLSHFHSFEPRDSLHPHFSRLTGFFVT